MPTPIHARQQMFKWAIESFEKPDLDRAEIVDSQLSLARTRRHLGIGLRQCARTSIYVAKCCNTFRNIFHPRLVVRFPVACLSQKFFPRVLVSLRGLRTERCTEGAGGD